MTVMSIYGKTNAKTFSYETKELMTAWLAICHNGIGIIIVCSNDYPDLTMNHSTVLSKLIFMLIQGPDICQVSGYRTTDPLIHVGIKFFKGLNADKLNRYWISCDINTSHIFMLILWIFYRRF